jgi:uncharacterized protein (DUF58 family)
MTSLVFVPLSMVAAFIPQWTVGACVIALVWTALAVADAFRTGDRLKGVKISLPDVVRLTMGQPTEVLLSIHNSHHKTLPLRVGVALPPMLSSAMADLQVTLNSEPEVQTVACTLQGEKRGHYQIFAGVMETLSQKKLWEVRQRFSLNTEVRVYPNLIGGHEQLKGLFRRQDWGLHAQRSIGKGREFEQLREYLPGDSFEDIDWKATARRRHPITRIYQVEQSQDIYIMLDASRLSTRSSTYLVDRRQHVREEGPSSQTIFDRYIAAALVMAVVTDRMADRLGLIVFSNQPDCFIKAGRGKAHYSACRDTLYTQVPHTVSPDYDELFTFIGTHVRKRALLLFLTNLDDPVLSESFLKAMTAAARQHVIVVNMLRPPDAYPLFSSADIRSSQGIYQHLVGHMVWESLNDTRRRLKQIGVDFGLLSEEQLYTQIVSQYIGVKQRQVL